MNATTTETTCEDCGGALVPVSSSALHEAHQWIRLWCKDKTDAEVHAMALALGSKIRRVRLEQLEADAELAEFVERENDKNRGSKALVSEALRESLEDQTR